MRNLTDPFPQWNATDTDFPRELCIHELFERQVAKSPDSLALIDGDKQLSYAEINAQVNRLARELQERGVGSGSIVGCHLKRSAAVVVFTLAIMKAGGTYILFDASMPASRLGFVIGDAKPVLIVTDTQLPAVSVGYELSVVPAGELVKRSQTRGDANLGLELDSSSPAYIAYTSGSTGKPKGVVITHRATVNHACAFSKLFNLSGSDRVPLMAPIAFDMAVEEMVPPLVSGCTLVVSRSRFASMTEFTREISQYSYTILNIPVPMWHEWTEYLEAKHLEVPVSLRLVITGSEEIEVKALETWVRLPGAKEVQWVAAYGTTETTVTSTFYTTAVKDDLSEEPFVPIGKPISNTYAYILNPAMKPVEVGKTGELYIGGEGVARGYFHRDELTRERFLPDPFRPEPGSSMFRTGDLARYRADGNIVWLGRTDDQFKRYGFRIEPAEIEAVLNQSKLVRESAVVMQRRGSRESDKQLVAFVVPVAGMEIDREELRRLTFHHLPGPLIPDAIVQLASLPVTASGKIDRTALEQTAP
jgi:amino acid adenylation domain-containing protein